MCERCKSQAFNLSLIALAGAKVSLLDAAIWMVAPVDGLRPSLAGEALTLNLPKPFNEISSPFAAASPIVANTASTIFRASALEISWSAAMASAISVLFMTLAFLC